MRKTSILPNSKNVLVAKGRAPKQLFEVFCIISSTNETQADILREICLSLGARLEDMAVLTKNGLFRVSVYFQNQAKAQRFQKKIRQLKLKNVVFRLRQIKVQDWKVKWAKTFSAFRLSPRLDVVPTWKRYQKTKREPIFLSSINAFGTGLHETTRFMALLIEHCAGRFKSFLDIGTGTGLLCCVAKKCQAEHVLAMDCDRGCVRSAKENFKVNGYHPKEVIYQDIALFKSQVRFDFVAANLITQDLIRLKNRLVRCVAPSGFLAISGISLENLSTIQHHFKPLPLRCKKILKGKQWVAILYQREKK